MNENRKSIGVRNEIVSAFFVEDTLKMRGNRAMDWMARPKRMPSPEKSIWVFLLNAGGIFLLLILLLFLTKFSIFILFIYK